MLTHNFWDTPPQSEGLTDYDQAHLKLYLRLLDAQEEGADWREIVGILFEIDPSTDDTYARHIYISHLDRAKWIRASGFAQFMERSRQ